MSARRAFTWPLAKSRTPGRTGASPSVSCRPSSIHHSDRGVDDYKTPEKREQERREYERRKNNIAYDHAQGKVTDGSLREAEVALGLGDVGAVPEPVDNATRPDADFKDGSGQEWDVKAFGTRYDENGNPYPGSGYSRTAAERHIKNKLQKGVKVALDLERLTPQERADLKDLVIRKDWTGEVVIY